LNDIKPSKEGTLFVLSAPSGTGKTTVCRGVVSRVIDLTLSVSYTTRERRVGETEGVDYHFVDEGTFGKMVKEGFFLEYAEIYGKKYGSSRDAVENFLCSGKDVILEIDVQGGMNVKSLIPEAVLIALIPPGIDSLYGRLRNRKRESDEEIHARILESRKELESLEGYDFFVINRELEDAILDVVSIIRAQALRIDRNRIFIQNIISQFWR